MKHARTSLVATMAASLLAVASAVTVAAHEPQSLPSAACNPGTLTAHESLGASAEGHERIPHSHDAGGTCVHLNPRD